MNWRCLPFTAMEILWGFVGPRCLYLNVAYAGEILDLKSAFATDPLCLIRRNPGVVDIHGNPVRLELGNDIDDLRISYVRTVFLERKSQH